MSGTNGNGAGSAGATTFRDRYEAAASANKSLLCVGLDPDPQFLPKGVDAETFLLRIVKATSDLVCAYKPNSAFFEALGPEGMSILRRVIDGIPKEVPVLLDAKRGDVDNTDRFYAKAAFKWLEAGAVTANPYLGLQALEPFLDGWPDRHTFVVCLNSNDGAAAIQQVEVRVGGKGKPLPLWEHVAMLTKAWAADRMNIGLVIGANHASEAATVRKLCPDWLFLMPGVGAQGADLHDAVLNGADDQGGGILVNASRSVLYAGFGKPGYDSRFDEYARDAAISLRASINKARSEKLEAAALRG